METIAQAYELEVGGGEIATVIEYTDHVIVIAFGLVGTYESIDHYLEGELHPGQLVVISPKAKRG